MTILACNNPYARPRPKKCFRCNQSGHRSNQCPKRQMINLIEVGGEAGDDEDGEARDDMPGYEAIEVFADEGVLLSRSLVIQRVLLVLDKRAKHRGTIFFALVALSTNKFVMSSSMEAVERTLFLKQWFQSLV